MIYKENPKGSINKTKQKKPRRMISEFSKVIGYKVNIESIVYPGIYLRNTKLIKF